VRRGKQSNKLGRRLVDNRAVPNPTGPLPILALMFNALVWGTSWWPFRALEQRGLHPLWATVFVYLLAAATIGLMRPRAFAHVARTPALWVLMAAAGITNASFNWAVVIGDVVRVVLLFYLMPLWAVLLARLLLQEPFTRAAGLRVAMAMVGAVIVLWPAERGLSWDAWPLPSSPADWLGLVGGFSFALNNVMLRREAARPEEARALAMFLGGTLVAGALGIVLSIQGGMAWPPSETGWMAYASVLAMLFLLSNWALQYGAARLPANVTSVVMLSEVVFATVSSIGLGGGRMTWPLAMGGALILVAAMLSAWTPERRAAA
jgi:drug/metabolite transporter (DMT)-like permease